MGSKKTDFGHRAAPKAPRRIHYGNFVKAGPAAIYLCTPRNTQSQAWRRRRRQKEDDWRGAQNAEVALTHLLCQELLAEPEVREDDVALRVEQHVLQLQVSVDDAQLAGARGGSEDPCPHTLSSRGHCSGQGGLQCRSGPGAG